eukprot:1569265-Rhodomonas_salina.2
MCIRDRYSFRGTAKQRAQYRFRGTAFCTCSAWCTRSLSSAARGTGEACGEEALKPLKPLQRSGKSGVGRGADGC